MLKAIVKRPEFDENDLEHPLVKLTATVKSGSVTKEFDKFVRVRREGLADSRAVILDLNDLSIPSTIKNNLSLVSKGKNGTEITWKTSNASAISISGIVKRADSGTEDVIVTLTATCTKGIESQTKEFKTTILSWTKEDELADAMSKVNWDLIKKDNIDSQAIVSDLSLPKTVGRNIAAKWSTVTATDYIAIDTGKITRPSYTQGQVTLLLVCTLTQDTVDYVVKLPAYIIKPKDMTNEEVVAYAKANLEAKLFLGDNISVNRIANDMSLPYRLDDTDASTATITWGLAASPGHTDLATSKYIVIENAVDHAAAKIKRPSSTDGNQNVSLKATITSGPTSNKASDTKFFDIIILAEESVV